MAKFYFASKDILGLGQHAYIVYDPDGDLETLADQIIYRGGPESDAFLFWGDLIIEPGFLNYNPELPDNVSEDSLDINESGLVDIGDLTTEQRFYYNLNIPDALADKVIIENWISSWGSPITGGIHDGKINTHLDYNPTGPNSNSVAATILNLMGQSFFSVAAQHPGPSLGQFKGWGYILDSTGDENYTAFSGGAYAFIDNDGNDTITIEDGAFIHIDGDGSSTGSNILVFDDSLAGDIGFIKWGNDLLIRNLSTGKFLGNIDDHFEGTGGVSFVQFKDSSGAVTSSKNMNTLTSSDFTNLTFSLPTWLINFINSYSASPYTIRDPLMVDLDGDGISADLKSTSLFDVYFDRDNDGFAESTNWVNWDDAFLVRDLNDNGRIDDTNEMFGARLGGFEMLGMHDENHDGMVNALDAVWADLMLWRDANADGQTQGDELLTLAAFGITGFDVVNYAYTGQISGVTHVGTALTDSGAIELSNVNLTYNELNTRYNGDYDFDIRAAFLPSIRGYAQVPDMHIALSLDNDEQDPDSLMALMLSLKEMSLTDIFTQWDSMTATMAQLHNRLANDNARYGYERRTARRRVM